MIDMAFACLNRVFPPCVAVGTAVAGVFAQAAPDSHVGQIGAGGVMVGATYLIIMFVREAGPTFLKWEEIRATSRTERVRMEELIRNMTKQSTSDAARIADLESRIAEAEQAAREAKNLIENAKIEADARAAAIEAKAREAGHTARNNTQRLNNTDQRLDDIEKAVASGSGDRDPEVAL